VLTWHFVYISFNDITSRYLIYGLLLLNIPIPEAARLLSLRVRIPPAALASVCLFGFCSYTSMGYEMGLVWNVAGPSTFLGVFGVNTLIKDAYLFETHVFSVHLSLFIQTWKTTYSQYSHIFTYIHIYSHIFTYIHIYSQYSPTHAHFLNDTIKL